MIQFKAKTDSGEIINSALSPFTFPAGEAHTKREDRRDLEATEIAIVYGSGDIHDDLFQLAMWTDTVSIHRPDARKELVIPYFPGARADRGTPLGAQIYSEFVYTSGVTGVHIYDPHSPIIVDMLGCDPEFMSLTVTYPHELLNTRQSKTVMPNKYDGIIAPDKGAVGRAQGVADVFGLPLFTAEKTRDFETGKLSGFHIEMPKDGHFLVVDDICDGGGTFLGLALTTPERVLLDLYVSHGVFSKNALYNLPQQFQNIFTTNSYDPQRVLDDHGDFGDPDAIDRFSRIDVITALLEKVK